MNDDLRDRRVQFTSDDALEIARAVHPVEAVREQVAAHGIICRPGDSAVAEGLGQSPQLEVDDGSCVVFVERCEPDDLVESVVELGIEELLDGSIDELTVGVRRVGRPADAGQETSQCRGILGAGLRCEFRGSEIGRQQHHAVAKADARRARGQSQCAAVEYLQ
ncbi:Uncharacterised protein [Mycobacteroides abscessus subsp. abscessus]|nr:Uncharacterised protein [Mycobacteroides abscessus subsp. abscessus]